MLEKIAIREFDKGEVNKAFAIAYACEEFQKKFQMTHVIPLVTTIQGRFLSSFYGEDIAENSLSFEYLVLLYAALENQYKQHNILNTIKNEAVKNLKLFAYPLELIQDPSYIKVDIEEMIIKYAITLKKLLLAYVKIDPLCTIIEDYIVAGELTQDRVFVKAEDFIKPGEFEQDAYVSLPLHGENADGGCCIL